MPHELDSFDAGTPAAAGEADRRTVRRVAAFGAATVAAIAMATAGVAQGAGTGSGTSSPLGSARPRLHAVATSSASAASSAASSTAPSAASATAAPQLRIQIAYDRVGRDLTLTFAFAGYVLEPLTAGGGKLMFPTPAKRDIGLGEALGWGDGTNSDVPVSGRRCPVNNEPRTVHEIQDTYSATKKYTAPGTYTVAYTYFACGLTDGKISGTLSITIPK
ncbi:MAG TPA: hypothetical protein VMZ00_14015 [Sporichthya sp.]|nr:hypothetical protein [Sporichthya sp.]